ncbi:LytS/YhcK type 5TM receptor domain-containing protein [Paenibacillus tarimensis]
MWELLLLMLERLGIIVTVALIMTRLRFVRQLIDRQSISWTQRLWIIIIFGCFGIMGTYTGVTINPEMLSYTRWTLSLQEGEAIANSRVIGIVVAGLLGGWQVGVGAGIIAGIHRSLLGGFTAYTCGFSTILAGALAGYIYKRKQNRRIISMQTAFAIGFLAEFMQMLVILAFARPWEKAWALVENIGLPMALANGAGAALFILIIRNVIQEEEKMGSVQAQKALRLADLTLKHMRKGLSEPSAKAACGILLKEIQVDAVSITNKLRVLSYVGIAEEHHNRDNEIRTTATKSVLQTGQLMVVHHGEIGCADKDCPLRSAVIAPLKQKGETIGTLKFYFTSGKEPSSMIIELSKGLSTLLSHQLELAEVDRHQELAKQAEIKALQAQVSPHFLFNALNTIVSLIRTDPMKARKLLISLSRFFRQNLEGTTMTTTSLEEELKHVKAYLAIEEARFADKLTVTYQVDESVLLAKVPPFTLQPIVENAVKHGIRHQPKENSISIAMKEGENSVLVTVEDNGIGIDRERLDALREFRTVKSDKGTGIGLYNVNRRLQMMFGEECGLAVASEKNNGTVVSFRLPLNGGEKA